MQTYHLIGIGGIGMSALARVLLEQGLFVQGSDQKKSFLTDQLQKEGILVHIGHSKENLHSATIVVYSSDIKDDNVEMLEAKKIGLPLWHRSDLLRFCAQKKKPLLVTGTHGKTTSTSLLAHLLLEAGLDPSFVVGGILLDRQTNGHFGQGEYFVAEADESDGSFLTPPAFGAIVTNLENDHLAYWKKPETLDEAFALFFSQVLSLKHLFWCADDPRLKALHPLGQSFGFSEEADWKISEFQQSESGILFDLSQGKKIYSSIEVSLFGKHNALNASAVFALALSLGANESALRAALVSFSGVKRRLEWKGKVNTIELFDDYGHHPTEIQVTLSALKAKIGTKRLVVVFQPHRYTRVQELMDMFAECFGLADLVVMTDIYAAGELPIEGLFALFYQRMQKRLGLKLNYFPRAELECQTAGLLTFHDVVLTIGAGDVTHAGEGILNKAGLCLLTGQ
jgi:UDP-N-acetylmuramate--alanine ligase